MKRHFLGVVVHWIALSVFLKVRLWVRYTRSSSEGLHQLPGAIPIYLNHTPYQVKGAFASSNNLALRQSIVRFPLEDESDTL